MAPFVIDENGLDFWLRRCVEYKITCPFISQLLTGSSRLLNGDTICIVGESGTAKTIVLQHFLAEVLSPKHVGGLDVGAVLLDSDGAFDFSLLIELIGLMPIYGNREIGKDGRSIHIWKKQNCANVSMAAVEPYALKNLYYSIIATPVTLLNIINSLDDFFSSNPNFRFLFLDSLTFWPHDTQFVACDIDGIIDASHEAQSAYNAAPEASYSTFLNTATAPNTSTTVMGSNLPAKRIHNNSKQFTESSKWKSSSLLTLAFQKLLDLQDRHNLIFLYTKSYSNMKQNITFRKLEAVLPYVYTNASSESKATNYSTSTSLATTHRSVQTFYGGDLVSVHFDLPSTVIMNANDSSRKEDRSSPTDTANSAPTVTTSKRKAFSLNEKRQFTLYLSKSVYAAGTTFHFHKSFPPVPTFLATAFHPLEKEEDEKMETTSLLKAEKNRTFSVASSMVGTVDLSLKPKSHEPGDLQNYYCTTAATSIFNLSKDAETDQTLKHSKAIQARKNIQNYCRVNFYALMNPKIILLLYSANEELHFSK